MLYKLIKKSGAEKADSGTLKVTICDKEVKTAFVFINFLPFLKEKSNPLSQIRYELTADSHSAQKGGILS